MPDTALAPFSDDGKSPSAPVIDRHDYAARLRAAADNFDRRGQNISRLSALNNLCTEVNAISNAALHESWSLRGIN